MVYRKMDEVLIQADESAIFVGQDGGAVFDRLAVRTLQSLRLANFDPGGRHFAITLNHAKHNRLGGTALGPAFAVLSLLVLFFAADIGRIVLNFTFERPIEGLGSN
jgi:hypothetical protein